MERSKYAPEFKSEAVKQVIDKGHAVVDVAKRLGIPEGVLYSWVYKFKSQTRRRQVTSRPCKSSWSNSSLNSGGPQRSVTS